MLTKANSELPLLSSITLTAKDSWEADIPSSQLSEEKQKSVCDPSYTHVHVFRHTHNPPPPPPPPKKLSRQLWADHISAAWASQPAELWVLSLEHLLKVKVRKIIPTLARWYVGSTSEGRAVYVCWELYGMEQQQKDSTTKLVCSWCFFSSKLVFTGMLRLFDEQVHCNSTAHILPDNITSRAKATSIGAVILQRAGWLITRFRIRDLIYPCKKQRGRGKKTSKPETVSNWTLIELL